MLQDGRARRYVTSMASSAASLPKGPVRSDGAVADFEVYRLSLVPRLWFLSQTTDCRVHEQKSAGDILPSMFTDAGLTDLSGPPSSSTRQYTIQFNETRPAFRHAADGGGRLVLFLPAHRERAHAGHRQPEYGVHRHISNATLYIVGGADDTTQLLDFNHDRHHRARQDDAAGLRTGQSRRAAAERAADRVADRRRRGARRIPLARRGELHQRERHRPVRQRQRQYPGAGGVVANRAKWEMEAAEAVATLFDGASQFGGMVPGGTFTVASQPASPYDEPMSVRSVTHHASDDTWLNQRGTASYSNRFIAFPFGDHLASADHHAAPAHEWHLYRVGHGSAEHGGLDHQRAERRGDLYRRHGAGEGAVLLGLARRIRPAATRSGRASIQPWAGKGWGAQFTAPRRHRSRGGLRRWRSRPARSSSAACTTARRRRST